MPSHTVCLPDTGTRTQSYISRCAPEKGWSISLAIKDNPLHAQTAWAHTRAHVRWACVFLGHNMYVGSQHACQPLEKSLQVSGVSLEGLRKRKCVSPGRISTQEGMCADVPSWQGLGEELSCTLKY